jgi:hypothetical protein
LPTSLALAIATALFDSPLSAGLVDEVSPVALAVVDGADKGTGLVGAVHLTSGRELVAVLTTGADAKFVAKQDPEHGVTLIRASAGEPRLAMAVIADYAIFGPSEALIVSAGSFLARSVAPAIGAGPTLELVAPKESLSGPLSEAARATFGALRERLVVADAAGRRDHGGRAPDFGDPSAVIASVSGLGDGMIAVLGSASEARVTATFSEGTPLVRVELSPDAMGAARDLTRTLPVGSLEPLLTLPDWVDAVLFNRSGESGGGPALADRLDGILGSRLAPSEREKTLGFVNGIARGVGQVQAVGLFGAQDTGLFVLGPSGDGAELRRAVLSLPDVARARAIADPLQTFVGRATFTRVKSKSGTDHVARVLLHGSPSPAGKGAASNPDISVVASSSGERVAVVAAKGDAAAKLGELLAPDTGRTLAADTVIARAVARAGVEADGALCLRVLSEDGSRSFAVVTAGSNRRVTWAEVGAGKEAFRLLARSLIGQ